VQWRNNVRLVALLSMELVSVTENRRFDQCFISECIGGRDRLWFQLLSNWQISPPMLSENSKAYFYARGMARMRPVSGSK